MIETAKQTREALVEIQGLTGWKYGRISAKIGLQRSSIKNILDEKVAMPHNSTMMIIDSLLTRVRKEHG